MAVDEIHFTIQKGSRWIGGRQYWIRYFINGVDITDSDGRIGSLDRITDTLWGAKRVAKRNVKKLRKTDPIKKGQHLIEMKYDSRKGKL